MSTVLQLRIALIVFFLLTMGSISLTSYFLMSWQWPWIPLTFLDCIFAFITFMIFLGWIEEESP